MGGLGSGSWQVRSRQTVEDVERLDVLELYRRGSIAPLEPVFGTRQRIRLTWTPCRFGGSRPWFLCPKCSKRVGALYGRALRCRTCAGLVYRSQLAHRADRLLRRAERIRGQIGGLWPEKPKGMHQATWLRLEAAAEAFEDSAVIVGMPARLNRLIGYSASDADEVIELARESARAGHSHQTAHAKQRARQRAAARRPQPQKEERRGQDPHDVLGVLREALAE